MALYEGVRVVDNVGDLNTLMKEAERDRWQIIEINLFGVGNKKELITKISTSINLDPPLISANNWDAFSDSLWGGIDVLSENRTMLILKDCSSFKRQCPDDWDTLLEILTDSVSGHSLNLESPERIISIILDLSSHFE